MKKYITLLLLTLSAAAIHAQDNNTYGIYLDATIKNQLNGKFISHQRYVFLSKKIENTIFATALTDNDKEFSYHCCLMIRKSEPLNSQEIIKKYHTDADFIERLTSIKGLPYIYQATIEKTQKKDQPALQNNQNEESTTFSMPIIGTHLIGIESKSKTITTTEGNKIKINAQYSKKQGRSFYSITENGKKTLFSEILYQNN